MKQPFHAKEIHPPCYGELEIVFPMGPEGLRDSPPTCMACPRKTECLRSALRGKQGISVREEKVDRAYASGTMGFFERWSRKKAMHRRTKEG